MKAIYWQLLAAVILIAYSMNWALIEDTGGDEKIYVIASAYLDKDVNINVEHPPLVKRFYNLLLTPEYKAQIYNDDTLTTNLLWIPNTYANDKQHRLILAGTKYLRFVNGLLISAFLLYVWWRSKDFTLFLGLFAVLMVSNQLFTALLDGWLFVGGVGGYFLLKYGNPVGWVLAICVAPLTKYYGFLLTPFSIADHATGAKQFAIVCAGFAAVILLGWGMPSITYGLNHFWLQFSGNHAVNYPDWPGPTAFFNLRYVTPFIGLLLVKYRDKVV
jgi:hypothetical protein